MSSIIKTLVLALLICVSTFFSVEVGAQPPAPSPAASNPHTASISAVDRFFIKIDSSLKDYGKDTVFKPLGERIAVTLFGVILIWSILKGWMTGKGMANLVADILQPLIILSLALAAVKFDLGENIRDSIFAVVKKLPHALPLSDGSPLERHMMDSFAVTGIKVMDSFTQDMTLFQSLAGLFKLDGAAWANLLTLPMKIVAGLALIVTGAVGAGMIIVAKISLALALLLGPVLIPWGMWKPTAFLFETWLSFLINSAGNVLVCSAVGGLLIHVVDGLTGGIVEAKDLGQALAFSCALILFAALNIYIMLQTPAIASGLFGGRGTLGLSGWTAAASAPSKMGGSAGRSIADGNAAAGKSAKGFADNAQQGFSGTRQPGQKMGYGHVAGMAARGASDFASDVANKASQAGSSAVSAAKVNFPKSPSASKGSSNP